MFSEVMIQVHANICGIQRGVLDHARALRIVLRDRSIDQRRLVA